ncbi:MAG: 30S ribosomal protein S5 [Planctomycetota bacterium]|jgi:small subunit ribosomal protein S5|nr:30S ribosomal protein S5 [Planctomycetota bacterium]NBX32557.1 30S ribosomal protein S5 [Planctomycetota bacterium]RLS23195.1 MAG: 30S ribosomal protein S5 [Planctomycetota bacterium]
MAELIDESSSIESTTVGVYRTSSTVAGGRRFSFAALVVVGDKQGQIGIGYAKSKQVPLAVEKAQKEARRKMVRYPLLRKTIPHAVEGHFGASKVRLVPANPGTGVLAGAAVRAVLEMLGIQDCLTKGYGSTNPKNLVKAVINALEQLQTREKVEQLRGVSIGATYVEESVERGLAAMPQAKSGDKMQAPKNTLGDERRRGGRGGPRAPRRFDESPAAAPATPAAPAPSAPPAS